MAVVSELPALISEEVIERVKDLNTTVIADALSNDAVMDYKIKSVTKKSTVVGTAITVDLGAGDNLFLHQAIYSGQEGYVLVVDGKDFKENAYLGELMAFAARARGIEGIIIDGLVRDKEVLETLELPIFAKGFIPSGPSKDGPGEINIPIMCGGVSVEPGDLVIGDEDGVVIVPKDKIQDALAGAEKKMAYENDRLIVLEKYENNDNPEEIITLEPSWLKEKIKSSLDN